MDHVAEAPQSIDPFVETVERIDSFVDYRRVVLTLAKDLHQLQQHADNLGLSDSARLIGEVLARIEEDVFRVAVVGEFKRGKSTFINALLGAEILPSDILPCSATLNRVTYGLKEMVRIDYRDGTSETVGLHDLKDFVTKLTPEAEERSATIKEAVVYYPCNYCKNNVECCDTPGLNDEANMTEVTLSVLPTIDAAIMVIMAQAPFSEYEREFLESRLLTSDLGRVLFVVTGIDRLNSPEEADRLIANIEQRIRRNVMDRAAAQFGKDSPEYETYLKKIGAPRVFGLSAYQALVAKQKGDEALLEVSRFPAFERQLEIFLTEHRSAVALQVPINRVISSSAEILQAIALHQQALTLKREDFDKAFDSSIAEIEKLKERRVRELAKIDEACRRVQSQIVPIVDGLPAHLRQAALECIDQAVIQPSDLKRQRDLTDRIGKAAMAAMRRAGEAEAGRIQTELERALANEIERLADFDDAVSRLMSFINIQFGAVDADGYYRGTGETAAAAIATFTGMGGIWSGYRIGGTKGALVGFAGSVGTIFTGAMLCAALALPITFPVILALSVASVFTGGWLSSKFLGSLRIERFKEQFKDAVAQELGRKLDAETIRRHAQEQVTAAFSALRNKVTAEVGAVLSDAEEKLFALKARSEGEQSMTEKERQELQEIRSSTEGILGNAQRLSRQLVEIVSV